MDLLGSPKLPLGGPRTLCCAHRCLVSFRLLWVFVFTAVKERRLCSTFLYCFDREAQLWLAALTQHYHTGAFTGFFHLTFDASALDSQRGSSAINGSGPAHSLNPIIIDLGFSPCTVSYAHKEIASFSLHGWGKQNQALTNMSILIKLNWGLALNEVLWCFWAEWPQ